MVEQSYAGSKQSTKASYRQLMQMRKKMNKSFNKIPTIKKKGQQDHEKEVEEAEKLLSQT